MELSCALLIIAASSVKGQDIRVSSQKVNGNDLLHDNHLVAHLVPKGAEEFEDSSTFQPFYYSKYKNVRCRTDDMEEGDEGNKSCDDYRMYKNYGSLDKCEEKCSEDPKCTGFEWNRKENCEIWKSESQCNCTEKTKKKYKSVCYWKHIWYGDDHYTPNWCDCD